jgi:YD repeat-containing protein
VVKETDVNGDFVQTTWDGVNRRLGRDKRGNVTRFDYDDVNRVVKVTDPAPFQAQTLETTYADALNRTTEKDRRGTLKVTQMDPLGRVVRVTRDAVVLETNAYDALGNKVLATDGESRKTQFVYDKANRLSAQTDGFETADAATTQYRYDENGKPHEGHRPRSTEAVPSQELVYDELNRVTDEWDGARDHTHYAYDEEGHRTLGAHAEGAGDCVPLRRAGQATLGHAAGAGIRRVPPGHGAGLRSNRNRIRQTDANTHVVRMDYDELNRLRFLRQDPDGLNLRTEHRYDANGNETTLVDPKTQTVTNVYDELNRLKTRAYAALPSEVAGQWRHTTAIGYTYDANGNVTEVQDSVASGTDPPVILTTTRVYDPLDRLTSETTPLTASLPPGPSDNRTVGYAYFNNGVRKTVTDPSGSVTEYAYDGQNRLQTATTAFGTPQAAATSYTYWPDDLLHTVTYPNGVVATNTYDAADRVASIVNAKAATTISSYAYGYDANSNRTSQVEVNGGLSETTTYGYDDLDRLKTITYPVDASHPAGHVVTYG